MMSLTFGLFIQVSDSGPHGLSVFFHHNHQIYEEFENWPNNA